MSYRRIAGAAAFLEDTHSKQATPATRGAVSLGILLARRLAVEGAEAEGGSADGAGAGFYDEVAGRRYVSSWRRGFKNALTDATTFDWVTILPSALGWVSYARNMLTATIRHELSSAAGADEADVCRAAVAAFVTEVDARWRDSPATGGACVFALVGALVATLPSGRAVYAACYDVLEQVVDRLVGHAEAATTSADVADHEHAATLIALGLAYAFVDASDDDRGSAVVKLLARAVENGAGSGGVVVMGAGVGLGFALAGVKANGPDVDALVSTLEAVVTGGDRSGDNGIERVAGGGFGLAIAAHALGRRGDGDRLRAVLDLLVGTATAPEATPADRVGCALGIPSLAAHCLKAGVLAGDDAHNLLRQLGGVCVCVCVCVFFFFFFLVVVVVVAVDLAVGI